MSKREKFCNRKWDGDAFEPHPFIWDELENENPEKICTNSLARYEHKKGFSLPFLNQVFQVVPGKRNITPLYTFIPTIKSFELDLIILTYLLRSHPVAINGEMVNEKQISGGEAFFRGPHALNTVPIKEKFGEDKQSFLSSGEKLRVHEEISSQFQVSRRPSGKAWKRRNISIFRVSTTQLGGMYRRLKCEVIFE
ncbi:MAG: DUF3786 domain-containing protein [Thermodesulfobacteriota bacterium]|nr:DUF3786 domain-containing protein [Thermodesulfobacteriota bacterium]